MRRFLRPWWLVSHLAVLALLVVMVSLGFWQLRRLEERRDLNDLQAERTAAAVVAVGTLAEGTAADGHPESVEYRVVEATGRYRAADEVAVRNRSRGGLPGVWLLTPLVLADGPALVVNRGWVPQSSSDPAARPPAPAPDGKVVVRGVVRVSEQRTGLGVADPAEGRLASLARPDIDRYAAQLDYAVHPFYLQLNSQDPPPGDYPRMLALPPPTEGPHLGYAVQWFIFSAIAVVGYPLVLRYVSRRPDAIA
ncbi:MAG: SURF1 family protein [bacterium]|nr:SURF1 family protein [bacterium]